MSRRGGDMENEGGNKHTGGRVDIAEAGVHDSALCFANMNDSALCLPWSQRNKWPYYLDVFSKISSRALITWSRAARVSFAMINSNITSDEREDSSSETHQWQPIALFISPPKLPCSA